MDLSHFWWQAGDGLLPGAGLPAAAGTSLRFRGTQTLSCHGGGSGTTSLWMKKTRISECGTVLPTMNIAPGITIDSDGHINGSSVRLRDPSAWYHIVVNADGTYVNGERVAGGSATSGGTFGSNFDGYMTEIIFIDGKKLPPTTFGKRDAHKVWIPINTGYTAAMYGPNGFYINTKDANQIGKDVSGNNRHATPNGFQLGNKYAWDYDACNDGPINNYSVLLGNHGYGENQEVDDRRTPSLGGLHVEFHPWDANRLGNNMAMKSGKYYWEVVQNHPNVMFDKFGVASNPWGGRPGWGRDPDNNYQYWGWELGNGKVHYSTTTGLQRDGTYGGNIWNNGEVLGVLLDVDARTVTFRKGNADQGVCYTGMNPQADQFFAFVGQDTGQFSNTWDFNCGTRPFTYTPPAGYKHCCASQLPAHSMPSTLTGQFFGNDRPAGQFVYTGCIPGRIQYGPVDVTYGNRTSQSNVEFLANGFKVLGTTGNNQAFIPWTVTTTHTDGPYNGEQVPFGASDRSPATACYN